MTPAAVMFAAGVVGVAPTGLTEDCWTVPLFLVAAELFYLVSEPPLVLLDFTACSCGTVMIYNRTLHWYPEEDGFERLF